MPIRFILLELRDDILSDRLELGIMSEYTRKMQTN